MFPFPFSFLSGAASDVPVERISNAQAMSFNGVDSYVETPNTPAFAFGTNGFTISVWVNFNSLMVSTYGYCILDLKNGSNCNPY